MLSKPEQIFIGKQEQVQPTGVLKQPTLAASRRASGQMSSSIRDKAHMAPPASGLVSRILSHEHSSSTTQKGLKSALVSNFVTFDALLSGLRSAFAHHLAAARPKPLGLIQVSDGTQFLLPLRFGPCDIRILVVEHSREVLAHAAAPAGSSAAPTGMYLKAQQFHVLSLTKWPQEPSARETERTEKQKEHVVPSNERTLFREKTKQKLVSAVSGSLAGEGISGIFKATALKAHINAQNTAERKGQATLPTIPPHAPLFFLPHIWEVVVCLEEHLLWWTLPYPLAERSSSATPGEVLHAEVAALAHGGDPSLASGMQVHYRVELPFHGFHWQLVSRQTRLLALVCHSTSGSTCGKQMSKPHSIAICDAWFGDVLRMVEIPACLLGGLLPDAFSHQKPSKAEWHPTSKLGTANNIVTVTVGGRAAVWPVHDLVHT
jgi:hypothetical protein